ncbi:MAG: hypothetical protein ACU0CA_10730 [Paracoccaceae bacterium]
MDLSKLIPEQQIAYVIDPRFPGGTSSAVAQELAVVSKLGRVEVHAISGKMFKGKVVPPQLRAALKNLGLTLIWDAPVISADIILLHNPSFLKFNDTLDTRFFARHLIVIAHENFLRPGQAEAFDVRRCLDLIDRASLALRKTIAPISPYNRTTILAWAQLNTLPACWSVTDLDWFNICDFETVAPTANPADRRGRHSRAGMEKFPGIAAMDLCFPASAQCNVILGADMFLKEGLRRPHWQMHAFRGLTLEQYFGMIDFMIYFTSPNWRESFGRVLAESIAAGKLVISDAGTASNFEGGVIAAQPCEVNDIVAKFIAQPKLYQSHVRQAQAKLERFSAQAFQEHFMLLTSQEIGADK